MLEYWKAALDFLKGQPFQNVLTASLVGGFFWAIYFCMTIGIPAHLNSIQDGYERIEARYSAEAKENRELFRETVKAMTAESKAERDAWTRMSEKITQLAEEMRLTRMAIRAKQPITD